MNATCWVYVKLPTGEFVRLPLKRFDDFQRRRCPLDLGLADQERYLHTAEITVDLDDRIPRRVIDAVFRRVRLAPDGTSDPEHGSLEREFMLLRSNTAQGGRPGERGPLESESFPGLLEASKRFEARRLDAVCTWRPSPSELLALGVLLSRSIKIQVTARERHVQQLLERSRDQRLLVASLARSKTWELTALAGADEEEVRAAVAANPATPIQVLEQLYGDRSELVVVALAGNVYVSEEWLSEKARDESSQVRAAVAANGRTPSFLVERMAWADRCESVRLAAQGHLAWNLSLAVNWASSQQASVTYLRQAAGDRRPEVRAAVAGNPRTPKDVLALFRNDANPKIRELADRRLQCQDSERRG